MMNRVLPTLGLALAMTAVAGAQETKPQENNDAKPKVVAAVPLMTGAAQAPALSVQETGPATPGMAAFTEVNTEWRKVDNAFMAKYRTAKTPEERQEIAKTRPLAADWMKRYWSVVEEHAKDPGALRALYWIYTHGRGTADATKALEAITKDHALAADIADFLGAIAMDFTTPSRALIEMIGEKHTDAAVRAKAIWYGANQQMNIAALVNDIEAADEKEIESLNRAYGAETVAKYKKAGQKKFEEWAIRDLERIKREFADVPMGKSKLGAMADDKLFLLKNLAIGCEAPEITGEDVEGVAFKLSDYRGKVVVLDFWGFW